jgi:hypothetical protein
MGQRVIGQGDSDDTIGYIYHLLQLALKRGSMHRHGEEKKTQNRLKTSHKGVDKVCNNKSDKDLADFFSLKNIHVFTRKSIYG